jgi:hypothetical protein
VWFFSWVSWGLPLDREIKGLSLYPEKSADGFISAGQAKQGSHLAPQDERAIRQTEPFTTSENLSFLRKPLAHLGGARWPLCWRETKGLSLYPEKSADGFISAGQAKQRSHLAPQDERAIRQTEPFTISENLSFLRKPSAHVGGARWPLCWRQPRCLWMIRRPLVMLIEIQTFHALR